MKKPPESIELELEQPEPEVMSAFLSAARASGMLSGVCTMCTRPFLTRGDNRLCPPCRSGKPDGWTPAHTVRKLRFGDCRRVPGLSDCEACAGNGVMGWQPGAPAIACPECEGFGQRGVSAPPASIGD